MPIKEPIIRPVQFRSVNLAPLPSANIRWASAESVNFMDHLYYLTNLALDYLLDDNLPPELLNQTLLSDPIAVVSDHKNELITHFHKLLIAACACLCIGISIPLFGFMIACCWCTGDKKSHKSKSGSSHGGGASSRSTSRSNHRSRTRSRSHHRSGHRGDPSSDSDWLALTARDSNSGGSGGHTSDDPSRSRHRSERGHHHRGYQRGHHRRANGLANSSSSSSSNNHQVYRSRSVPSSLRYESSCHPCLRTFFSTNLFMTLLLIAFFTICAFVTNEYIHQGVKQMPKSVNQTLDDLQTYLNNTNYQVENLFKTNFNQLENEINNRLDDGGRIINHKLATSSEAIALVNLSDLVSEFSDTRTRLEKLDRELANLKTQVATVKKFLVDIRTKLETCPVSQCTFMRKKYGNLDNFVVYSFFEKIPDVKTYIKKMSRLIDTGIVAQIQQGRDNFDQVGKIIQAEVNKTSPAIKSQITILGRKLSMLSNEISQTIRLSDNLLTQAKTNARKIEQYSDYELYRRYDFLIGASVILFILLCYTLGWLFGSCRPQPTARTYKTHIKTSASASFPFSLGIFMVFLLFLPLILCSIILFLTGSVGDKIVCQTIKTPEQKQSKQIYAMLQNKYFGSQISLNNISEERVFIEKIEGRDHKIYQPNYADLIERCHQNYSIYKVLNLAKYDKVRLFDDGKGKRVTFGFDKSSYPNSGAEFRKLNQIDTKVKDLVRNIDPSQMVLLNRQAEVILTTTDELDFEDFESSFQRIYDNGNAGISPIDIEQLVKDIKEQTKLIADINPDMEADLAYVGILASSVSEKVLPSLTASIVHLRESIRHLKLRMFRGHTNFGSVTSELIGRIKNAERQLKTNGRNLLQTSANEFVEDIVGLIDQYANHVRNQVENVIGQCEPVSRAINSTTSTLCDDIILPFNGYNLSIIASLILILPATLIAYALRGLYTLGKRTASGGLHHLSSNTHHHHHHQHPGSRHHQYNCYTDQEDSYEDDGDEVAFSYHVGPRHPHLPTHKATNSSTPTAPPATAARTDADWSPSSGSGYPLTARPPPYAV